MFGLFGKEPDFEIDDLIENMTDAFREAGFGVSKKKTKGPVMGDGFKNNYIEVNLGSDVYYTMIHFKINKSNKIVEIKAKATYHKDYSFSTCPYFYKQFPKFEDVLSIASIKNQTDLWEFCKHYADAVKPTIEYKYKVFKEEINKTIKEYKSEDGKNRGIICMFDAKNKKELMLKEILDKDTQLYLYDILGDEDFLPQAAKDVFLF